MSGQKGQAQHFLVDEKKKNCPLGKYLEFVMMFLFPVQVANRNDPSSVGVDAKRQHLLAIGPRFEAADLVGDSSVFAVVGVVGLNADDAVAHRDVLHDRLLKKGRVESRRIVVDVSDIDQQLSRIGTARIAAI